MYQKIVVAYDGTTPGDVALQQAADLAQQCRAQLHIVGVVVTSGGLMFDPSVVSVDLLSSERQILEAALNVTLGDLKQRGIIAHACVRDGDAAREIIDYVRQVDANLVVVGHAHKGLLERWLEGSVGSHLLDTMPCSLLVAVAP